MLSGQAVSKYGVPSSRTFHSVERFTIRSAKITQPNSENHGCVRDLPLFVEMAGSRAELGVLVAGSPYPQVTASADAAGYVEVEPYGRQWLVLAKGARLLVRDSDLARCHTP